MEYTPDVGSGSPRDTNGSERFVYIPAPGSALAPVVSLAEYWQRIRSRWRSVLAVVLVLTGGTGAYLFLIMPASYVATVSMIHVNPASAPASATGRAGGEEPSGRQDTATVQATTGSEEEAAAILVSRTFTQAFIEDRDLLPVLFRERWDDSRQAWREGERVPTLLEGYYRFNEKVRSVEKQQSTGLTRLSIRWRDPELAAEWANDLVARLNTYLKERDRRRAQQRLEYLETGISNTEVATIESWLYGMMQKELETIMLTDVSDDYAYSIIDAAVAPERPVWTLLKKAALMVLVLVVALVLGALLALLLSAIEADRDAIGA
jgi:uncharacterized protein involved in exopolysaccharide biosynthesis